MLFDFILGGELTQWWSGLLLAGSGHPMGGNARDGTWLDNIDTRPVPSSFSPPLPPFESSYPPPNQPPSDFPKCHFCLFSGYPLCVHHLGMGETSKFKKSQICRGFCVLSAVQAGVCVHVCVYWGG